MWDCRLPGEHLKALRELEGDMIILTDYSGIGVELELLPILRYLPIRSVKMLRHVQEKLHGWVPSLNSKAKVCYFTTRSVSLCSYSLISSMF